MNFEKITSIFKYMIRKSMYIIATLCCLSIVLATNYIMPSYEKVVFTGGEAKRYLKKDNKTEGKNDIYYLYTQNANSPDKVNVFKNEDTGWGFPFYFKFNSADLQAKAQSLANSKQVAEIKYYGWRIDMFSMFKNIIKITPLKENDKISTPYVSYLIYLLALLAWIYWLFKIRFFIEQSNFLSEDNE